MLDIINDVRVGEIRGLEKKYQKYSSAMSHIVGALPIEIVTEVGDLIDQVPEIERYDKIKAAVLQRTSVSDKKDYSNCQHHAN